MPNLRSVPRQSLGEISIAPETHRAESVANVVRDADAQAGTVAANQRILETLTPIYGEGLSAGNDPDGSNRLQFRISKSVAYDKAADGAVFAPFRTHDERMGMMALALTNAQSTSDHFMADSLRKVIKFESEVIRPHLQRISNSPIERLPEPTASTALEQPPRQDNERARQAEPDISDGGEPLQQRGRREGGALEERSRNHVRGL